MPARRKTARRPMSAAAKKRMLARRRATMRANGTLATRAPVRRRRRTSTALARPRRRKCALNEARTLDGGCSSRVPCLDPSTGQVVPYATRGADGKCRIKTAPKGQILDPETGKAISIKTPKGERLNLAKRYDDADRFITSYKSASTAAGLTSVPRYYSRFIPSQFRNAQIARARAAQADVRIKIAEAERKREQEETLESQNRILTRNLSRNLRQGTNAFGARFNPQAGGSSFNMNPASSSSMFGI